MNYCRKIFAIYICSQGVDSEIANLLQGRIEKDVFVRNYNRPDLDTIFSRVCNSVESLEKLTVESGRSSKRITVRKNYVRYIFQWYKYKISDHFIYVQYIMIALRGSSK
jgi:hypothetical protein